MLLAIDIGATKTLLAVFSLEGKIVAEYKFATNKTYKGWLKDLDKAVHEQLRNFKISACCCAFPGAIDRKHGVALRAGNLSWHYVTLVKDLEKMFDWLPVFIENDAKLAGLSEALLVHKKYKKVLYLTVSTGIGGGIIINGKIDPVLMDMEPGRMILEHDGKLHKWEDFASGKALVKRYGKRASEIEDPKIWQSFAHDIVLGLEQLLAVLQPDVVIIGGGVGAHFDKFAGPLYQQLKKIKDPLIKVPPIIQANRPEEAVVYGCYDYYRQQS